jgi:uncharacterized protein YcbK (DUF882 family)
MISMKEFLGHATIADLSLDHAHNAEELLKRINILREAWGKPWIVTSGYRTMQDHLRIYSQINSKRRAQGLDDLRVPTSSKHLSGEAIDIYDSGLKITKWLKENDSARLQAVDLYCEEGNDNWVHFQLRPPKSGKRWFKP